VTQAGKRHGKSERGDEDHRIEVKVIDRRSPRLRAAAGEGDSAGRPLETGAGPSDAAPAAEAEQAAGADRRLPTYVEELKARAEDAERKTQEIIEAHRRALTEQDEYRKRLSRDLERRVNAEIGALLCRLIEILDDLDLALKHADESPETMSAPAPGNLRTGVRLVRDRYLKTLAEAGVEPLSVKGLPFDPEQAEAVRVEDVGDGSQDGMVLEEMRPGYAFRGQVLRPARVVVGRKLPSPGGGR
jgi:molecular chaperone GrpE